MSSYKYDKCFCKAFGIDPCTIYSFDLILDTILKCGSINEQYHIVFPINVMNIINTKLGYNYKKFDPNVIKKFIKLCQKDSCIFDKYVCITYPDDIQVTNIEIDL